MSEHVKHSKKALRQHIAARLKTMTPGKRAAASAEACALLEKQAVWQRAQFILFYAPMPHELDIWRLVEDSLAAGKTVALPRFDSAAKHYVACRIQNTADDVVTGHVGIREPAAHCGRLELTEPELVLVPGVAFDRHGGRLGRGKGYYDRILSLVRGRTCGVAFDEQVVDEIPVESHDVHVNFVLTPTRWIAA